MKTSDIAAVIKRDLLRRDIRPATNIAACHSCGRSYRYKGWDGDNNGMFCSDRCRDWYDAGNPSYEQQQEWIRKPPAMSIVCLGCGKEFESRGLRCCSTECERGYRERRDNLAVMAEVGIEPATKRKCEREGCINTIPKWRNGRRVSSATRFCGPRCQNAQKRAQTLKKSA